VKIRWIGSLLVKTKWSLLTLVTVLSAEDQLQEQTISSDGSLKTITLNSFECSEKDKLFPHMPISSTTPR